MPVQIRLLVGEPVLKIRFALGIAPSEFELQAAEYDVPPEMFKCGYGGRYKEAANRNVKIRLQHIGVIYTCFKEV